MIVINPKKYDLYHPESSSFEFQQALNDTNKVQLLHITNSRKTLEDYMSQTNKNQQVTSK